jgi:transcriptional regulator CtsR
VLRFHKKIKRYIDSAKRCFDWFNSKKHQKSIFRLGSQIIFSLIIVAQFTGTSAALAVNTNNMDNAQSSGGYLQEKNITWGDGTIEDLRLESDGYFLLNGVKQRLVGFHFGVPTPKYDEEWNPSATGSKTQFWTTENLAFLDNMLSYLQSKGVRIIRIPLVYTYLASTIDEANAYKALFDLTAKHKMYVVGWLVGKWFTGFNCVQPTSNFVIPGGTNGDTLDTWLNRLVPIVAQYPNIVVMNCENELDGPYEFSSTTTSSGNVGGTTMIDTAFGTGANNKNPVGWTITITSGACSGQSRTGSSLAGTTMTLASAFSANIVSGITYTAKQNYSVADAVAHFTYLKNKFKASIPNIMITHNFCDVTVYGTPFTKALLPLLDFPSFDVYALTAGDVTTLISKIKSTYGINNFWMEEIGQASQSVPYVDNTAFSSSFIDNAFTGGATIAVMYCALHDYWTSMSFFNPHGVPSANTDSLLTNNMATWQTAIPSGAPAITDSTGASNITTTAATLNGNLTSDGGAASTVSVYWGATDGGTTAASWSGNVAVGTQSVGAFTANLTGLTASTTYYYRCYASNSAGSAWASSSASFTTSAPAPPAVTAAAVTNSTGASNITSTAARLNGEVTSTGNENPTVHVYWGPADGGTIVANWAHDLNLGVKGAGVFYTDITGLTAGATYYYLCMAQNSGGMTWALSSSSFTTSAPAPPPVTAPAVTNSTGGSNITTTAATLNGNLTSDGGAASTVSVYWGTTDGGTTAASWSGNVAVGTQSVGAFTANLTGLTASTTYYYRCYASNSAGSAWASSSASFTTSAPAPPAVTTPTITDSTGASNIATTTARLDGELTATGNENPTVHVYWGPADGGTTAANWAHDLNLGAKGASFFYTDITGLTAGTTYYYSCMAQNSGGISWASSSASFTTSAPAPAPPAVTTPTITDSTGASNITTTAATLNGNLTSDGGAASTVSVYWGTTDGGTTAASWSGNVAVGTQSVGAFTASLTGLTSGTTYYYRCYASNSAGSAWAPASASFTTSAPARSSVTTPSGLSATPVSATQINLSWTDNSNNETGFKIERKTGAGVFAQIATVGANVTTYSNSTGLVANTTYTYRVRYYQGTTLNSDYSNEAYATTLPPPPPVPVLVAPAVGSVISTLTPTLAWNTASGAASYGVQVSTSPTFATTVVNQSGLSSTQYAIASGLSWNTLYYWRANDTNSSGSSSAWSAAWVFVTAAGPPPAAPSNLTATVVSSSQINLSWQDNSNNETGFAIERKTGSGGTYAQIATVGANVTSYNSTTLSASTLYYYRVRAYNTSGKSDYSNEAYATTLPPPPPVPVLVAPAVGSVISTLTPTLAWNTASGAASYGVQVSTSPTFATTVVNQSGLSSTQYAVASGLSWKTLYYWRANDTNSLGSSSAWSAVWLFVTAAGPPPAAPSNLTATVVSSSQINLSWQDNSNNETGFAVERKTGSGGTYAQIATVGANVTSYNSTTLSASTLYYYRVRAYNANGNSDYSNEAYATTLPPPPPVPVLVSPANGATGQSLTPTLAWNASTGANSYGVQLSTSATFATTVVNQSGLSSTQYAVASGLSWNTLYYWRANATNSLGSSSAWSAAWLFATAARPK